jgi:MFS family permease
MRSPAAIIASAVLVVIADALPGLLLGSLAGAMRADLGLSNTGLGLAAAVFWFAAAVGSAPGGRFVDRFGPTRGIHVGGALAALGSAGVAMSGSPALLFISLAVGGAANALATPGVSALASGAIAKQRLGLAFGLQQAAPPLAALVAGLALPVLGGTVGWRPVFAAAAVLAAAAAAAAPRMNAERAAATRSRGPRRRALLLFAAGAVGANAAAGAALTFLVSYGVQIGLSAGAAGALFAVASGSAVAVRLGLGVLADHRPDAAPRWIAAQLVAAAAGHALLTAPSPALVAIGAIAALALGWGWAGLFLFAIVRHSRGEPGAAVGVVAIGFFGGAVLGPLAAGVIAELASFEVLWWLCAGVSLLAAGAIHAGARSLRG